MSRSLTRDDVVFRLRFLIVLAIFLLGACGSQGQEDGAHTSKDQVSTQTRDRSYIGSPPASDLRSEGTLRLVFQSGHSSEVKSVAFSPDGRFALSGGYDDTLRLWEVSTGREIRTFKGHSALVTSVDFSPSGRFALSGSHDRTLRLWDVFTGKEIRVFSGHGDVVTSVAFSPAYSIVLSGSRDHTVKLWSIDTGSELGTLIKHKGEVSAVNFSPDGRLAISGGEDKTIRLCDVLTGKELQTFTGHSNVVTSVCFSPDGKLILSGSTDGTLRLWEMATGRNIRIFRGHLLWVSHVAFSPDGSFALSSSGDNTIRLWEISTSKQLMVLGKRINRSPNGLRGDSSWTNCVAFSPDGRFGLSGSRDGTTEMNTLRLWDLTSGRNVRRFGRPYADVRSVAFSSDGRLALSASGDGTLKLFDLKKGRVIQTYRGHTGKVNSAVFSRDNRFALSGGDDGTLKLWDVSTGRNKRTFKGHFMAVNSVALSRDGCLALSGSDDRTIKLWEVSTGRELKTFKGHTKNISCVALSPDGRFALSGEFVSFNPNLKLWDVSLGREIRTLEGHPPAVMAVAFSPDGRLAISGGYDLTPRLWDIPSGRQIRLFQGHGAHVNTVAFSLDGRFVLSGSRDNTLRLWEVTTGRQLKVFHGDVDTFTSVSFSPENRLALSGSMDGTTRVWDVETGEEIVKIACSSEDEWIVSTPDAYYDTSPEGAALIHWVFSKPFQSRASMNFGETFSFEQFESRFKRPDIIRARLSGDLAAGKPSPAMRRPPHLDMPDHMTYKKILSSNFTLPLKVTALKEVKTVRVFVNGKPTLEIPVHEKEKELSLNVPIFYGANRITALAFDEKGFSSNPKYVDIISQNTTLAKPDLYVFAIGISKYPKLPSNWQLLYAHTDAQALIKSIQKQEGKLFRKVHYNLLTNKEATLENIKNVLNALIGIKENDIAVIFMAGHGIKGKDETFYFLTSSGSFEEPYGGGLSWEVLGKYLVKIKGRVIMFLDACHSGSIATETVVPNDELAQQFFKGGRGGIMVFSASKGRQVSLESPDIGGGFGIFSYALIQGLNLKANQADLNNNGYVEFMELVDYVRRYVDKMTKGEQTPWLSRKELFGDLPIAMVNKR